MGGGISGLELPSCPSQLLHKVMDTFQNGFHIMRTLNGLSSSSGALINVIHRHHATGQSFVRARFIPIFVYIRLNRIQ